MDKPFMKCVVEEDGTMRLEPVEKPRVRPRGPYDATANLWLTARGRVISEAEIAFAGQLDGQFQQARRAGKQSAATRRATSDQMRVWVEEKKNRNPHLSDQSAIRLYLEHHDATFHAGPREEQHAKIENKRQALMRARR